MLPLSSSFTKRKRSRKPTSLCPSDLTSSSPSGLAYSPQLIDQARTGYTSLISIAELRDAFASFYSAVQAEPEPLTDGADSAEDAAFSCDELRLPTPFQAVHDRIGEEVQRVGEWMAERQEELQEMERRAAEQERESRRKTKQEKEQKHSDEQPQPEAKAIDERKEAADDEKEQQPAAAETKRRRVKAKQESSEEQKEAVASSGGRKSRRGSGVGLSLSAVSTARSPLELAAGVPLPDSFGSSVPSYTELCDALSIPPAALQTVLPLSLFPAVVDHNSITNELFLHRLETKLKAAEEAKDAADGAHELPAFTPIIAVHVYASASHRKQQEILLHADQPLSALTAAIRCERSPDVSSAFLYVERVLYTDDESAAAPVLSWLSSQPSHPLYPTVVQPLRSTTFASLTPFRLGSHYLFHHGADCCHTVMVQSVRCLHPRYHLTDGRLYPLELWLRHERKSKCGACRLFAAQYAVYDDLLLHDNPTCLCEACYRLLHYDREGKLQYGDFRVYKL